MVDRFGFFVRFAACTLSALTISFHAATAYAAGPTVSFTNLSDGKVIVGPYTIGASATPTTGKTISKLEIYISPVGTPAGTAKVSRNTKTVTYFWNTITVPDAAYTVTAKITDSANATASKSVTVSVDNIDDVKPVSSITSPANGAKLSGTATIQATASDDRSGIARVEFWIDGALVGSSTTAPYTYAWNTTTAIEGQHALNVVAYDKKGNSAPSNSITVTVDNIADPVPGTAYQNGERQVPSCSNTGGTGILPCYWKYRYDPVQCTNTGCTKMVIFFSGGDMLCGFNGAAGNYEEILDFYAQRGYVAVCAQTYANAGPTRTYTFTAEATRVNELVKNIRSDATIQTAWDGENLLFSGVSHGATSPVITMAHEAYDNDATWKGTKKTGACFYDGLYDETAQKNFIVQNNCVATGTTIDWTQQLGRYCGGPVSTPCANYDTASAVDTIANVDPSAFAIPNWKLMSCGSNPGTVQGWPACDWDVVTNPPVKDLCTKINAASGHHCAYQDFPLPQYNHFNCARERVDDCRSWFEALP